MSDKNKINEKKYWRSLDQLAETEEFKQFLHREFPEGASEMNNAWSRRNFLTLMGASIALAGLAGCRRPKEKIVPYVTPPEEIIPGIPQQYATTMTLGSNAYGVVVESHEGRPTKIEGNKLHPSTKGASSTLIQASILGLYDPDRSQKVTYNKEEKTWDDFMSAWDSIHKEHLADKGEGLAILSEEYTSPTIDNLREQFEKTFPKATWVNYDPISDENIVKEIEKTSEVELKPQYDFSKAKVILSLDSDFNITESDNIKASRDFASGRNLYDENSSMNRLYVVESRFSTTGAMADHRLALMPTDIELFTLALAKKLGVKGISDSELNLPEKAKKWIEPLVEDLLANKGKAVITAGRNLSPEVHALVYIINNSILDADNKSVRYIGESLKHLSSTDKFQDLNRNINSRIFSTLIIIGGNPAYNAPSDFDFSKSLSNVKNKIHLSLYDNQTSELCDWNLPMTYYLEHWSDARAVDGTLSVVQPLIAPLFDSKSPIELLHIVNNNEYKSGYELVKDNWRVVFKTNFEKNWRRLLHDGVLKDPAGKFGFKRRVYQASNVSKYANAIKNRSSNGTTLVFSASPSVYDGRFANNGWLQELPDAITRISWDNVAQMSKATADKYGLENEDLINIKAKDSEIQMPVWIVPGTADDTIIVELGYGQEGWGRVASGTGFNAYKLRTSDNMNYVDNVEISKTGEKYELANVQDHGSMEGRAIVREASLNEYKDDPEFAPHMVHHPPLESMWNEFKYDKGNQWGMAIDLTTCTGCNACVIACQSENNIPIIGKQEVRNGREMHWIRLDRYYNGDTDNPEMVHQPVACHHCEMAPCEQVCPVAATVHDKEGLNTMVYNRCIGTRYCSNNCPYKVRRFNYFNFTKETPEIVKMAMNPDVTVRSRGVMEKCTYCIQRINKVKIEAKKEDRSIKDGEIVTACQQACPTNAIAFGDINNPDSEVVKIKKRNRNYSLLGELNVRPRTTYLAKIRNKNPKMPDA
jgi:molybdopterin-containing oxidoreductase family iron-sulfur binding subunit